MIYQEFLPGEGLSKFVACYWSLRSEHADHITYKSILPDGCTDIIFNMAGPLLFKTTQGYDVNRYRGFIVGNMTRPRLTSAEDTYDLFAIRFKPAGLSAFIHHSLEAFTNEIADLDIYEKFHGWTDMVVAKSSSQERCALLNSLLLKRFSYTPILPVYEALRIMHRHNGHYKISGLSRDAGLSQKQLERQFLYYVGITPKQMARIIQFRHMVNLIRHKGEDSLLQMAVDGGYSDHAHFTKSFREFSGVTPREYIRRS